MEQVTLVIDEKTGDYKQWFNGTIGVLVFEDEQLATAMTIETSFGRINRIYAVRNPSKFGGFIIRKSGAERSEL